MRDRTTFKISEEKRRKIIKDAANDLAKKMRLEPRLVRKMAKFLRKIGKDSKQYFIDNGLILPVSNYRAELTKILFEHYLSVYKAFKNSKRTTDEFYKSYIAKMLVTQLEKKDKENDREIEKRIDQSIEEQAIEYSANRAGKQSKLILDTTQKQIEESYYDAQAQATELGSESANTYIADSAEETFSKKSKSRPKGIAVTETQAVAEQTKYIEANTVAYNIGFGTSGEIEVAPAESYNPLEDIDTEPLKGYNIKYWVTMADNKVRDWHVDAEGQIQFADEPFEVMGELLMMPGDESLGASAANVCNCRCTARYETIE